MDYKKTTWVPNETPLSAENFNNMEKGIENATTKVNKAADDISKLNSNVENFKTYNLSLFPIIKGTIKLRDGWANFINNLKFELDDVQILSQCILAKFTNNYIITLQRVGDNNFIILQDSSGKNICELYSDATGDTRHYTTSEYLIATYVYPNADNTIFEVIRDDDSYQHSIALYFQILQNEHSSLNSLTTAKEILINDNLNKYITPGNYSFHLNAANVYLFNTPTTERFNLKVSYSLNNAYPNRVTQQLIDTNGNIFIRTTANKGSSWTAWHQLAITDNTEVYPSLVKSSQIANGSDLNTIIVPGMYRFASTANISTLLNCPASNVFNLEVSHSLRLDSLKAYITQKITDKKGNQYIRTSENSGSTWNEWFTIATTKYVDTTIKEATTIKTINCLNLFNLTYLKQEDLINAEIHFIPKQITINYIDLEIHGMYVEIVDIPEAEAIAAIVYFDSFVGGVHSFDMLELWKDGSLNGVIGSYQIQDVPEIAITAFDGELIILKCIK